MKNLRYPNEEGHFFNIEARSFEEMHGITLCCVIMDEEKEIRELFKHHKDYVDAIHMIDGGSIDRTIEFATPLVDQITMRPFDGHYSNQANRVIETARTDWILLLDADERLPVELMKKLPELISQEEIDNYSFPRKEIIDGEEQKDLYPDYQDRLFRSYCRRIRPIHGEVVGFHNRKELPKDGNWDIIHKKNGERNNQRNVGYGVFEMHYMHEIGGPGTQTKKNYIKEYPHLLEKSLEEKEEQK